MNKPISFFIPALNGGGAQKVVVNLANALVDLIDHPIHVVLARQEGEFLHELRSEIKIVDLGTKRASRSVFALARYMRQQRPHVVVSSLNYANVICLIAGLLAKKPCRIVVREDNVVRKPSGSLGFRIRAFTMQTMMRIFYPYADSVVAISDAVLGTILDARISVGKAAKVIGNPIAVNSENNDEKIPDELARLRQPFICGIGRLSPPKGFDRLLQAFAKVQNQNLHLVILGEGELRTALNRQAKELGISDRVHMPGFIYNPMTVLRRAEAFVLSSRWEGFGNVLVEALAVGVPVVSTDCPGGPRAILQDGAQGHLVPCDDPCALASGIEQTLTHPAGTPESRRQRAADFSAEKIAREYLDRVLLPYREPLLK